LGKTLSWATVPIIEENNPRFFAGHVGVGGDDVDAGLAQRLKYRSQPIFSDGEVAIDYDVLIRTGKMPPKCSPPLYYQDRRCGTLAGCPKVNLIIPWSATNILLAT
jgi:hypothetical protein